MLKFLLLSVSVVLQCTILSAKPVADNGWLSVDGRYIVNQKGEKIALHGVSFGWHNWWHRYFNEGAVAKVANDWKASIVRCSIGLDLDDMSYNKNPKLAYSTVDRMVEAAVANEVYIIIDFHSHNNNLVLARQFFTHVAGKYGHLPNVLYEIWNEPTEVQWSEIKAYSEELIPIIRKYAPKSIIIVPTPRWDQDVDKAADNPITKFGNLVYSLHYYAATHKDNYRRKALYAISKGLPLFMSECAAMEHTGDGVIDMASWDEWMKLAANNNISWIAWSVSDKNETCSMLKPGTVADGGQWSESDLKPWALIVRQYLREAARATKQDGKFVTVRNGKFYIGNTLYNYVGTNFWYAPILASDGIGGDRKRLMKELDAMQAVGINNLRILVGGDGPDGIPSHVEPTLQKSPGVYNDTLLTGLDRLIAELENRGMKAVLYLNNAWEWSGGYSTYLEWAGAGKAPVPSVDGWSAYMEYVKQFVRNEQAKKMSFDHVRYIVGRKNSITGKPYKDSPAIMSWQVANEPRAFSKENKKLFAEWVVATAELIRSIDPNHLVSTGSEGSWGCEDDLDLWGEIHCNSAIDYANIHIWPYNWGWISKNTIESGVEKACKNTGKYIEQHYHMLQKCAKPLVLEEFGYPRDNLSFTPGSPTKGRDAYYEYVFSIIRDSGMIAGCNFWGWGGYAVPKHKFWQRGDDYTGDPSQEEQGLNSVFVTDKSTLSVIKKMIEAITKSYK